MPAEEVPLFFDNTLAAHELEQWKIDPEMEDRLRSLMAVGSATVIPNSVRQHYEQLWQQLYKYRRGCFLRLFWFDKCDNW